MPPSEDAITMKRLYLHWLHLPARPTPDIFSASTFFSRNLFLFVNTPAKLNMLVIINTYKNCQSTGRIKVFIGSTMRQFAAFSNTWFCVNSKERVRFPTRVSTKACPPVWSFWKRDLPASPPRTFPGSGWGSFGFLSTFYGRTFLAAPLSIT